MPDKFRGFRWTLGDNAGLPTTTTLDIRDGQRVYNEEGEHVLAIEIRAGKKVRLRRTSSLLHVVAVSVMF